MPCDKTLSSDTGEVTKKLMTRIKKDLLTARRVHATTDIWSSKLGVDSYLGISVHFVNSQEKKRQSLRIGLNLSFIKSFVHDVSSACRQFNCAHTGLAIAEKLLEIFKEFSIEDKMSHCITDSAGNMIKGKAISKLF